jgi:hypothetical protein
MLHAAGCSASIEIFWVDNAFMTVFPFFMLPGCGLQRSVVARVSVLRARPILADGCRCRYATHRYADIRVSVIVASLVDATVVELMRKRSAIFDVPSTIESRSPR